MGTLGRKGFSAQHLVPKLMKGGSWPTSQEGIHLHKVPHQHSLPGNLHTDGSLSPPEADPSTLPRGSGRRGKSGRGEPHDLGLQEVKTSLK